MTDFLGVVLVVHVTANLVWIGSIMAVTWVLGSSVATPAERGRLALGVYQQLAVPAMLLSVGAAMLRLFSNLDLYFVVTRYMHGKLFFALVVLGLHHLVGGAARGMANGKRTEPGRVKLVGVFILVCAAAAAFLAVLKPF